MRKKRICPECYGTGNKPGMWIGLFYSICRRCGGSGWVDA